MQYFLKLPWAVLFILSGSGGFVDPGGGVGDPGGGFQDG